MVAIRSEKDPETIKHFTADQKKIYDAWKSQETERMKDMPKEMFEKEMVNLEKMFLAMLG